MKSLAFLAIILTVSVVVAFNLRRIGNGTLQQQQENEAEFHSRIYNGHYAHHFQFPYQVGLHIHHANGDYEDCSGSLIGHEWVLTAAHCLEHGTRIVVYLGGLEFHTAQMVFHRGMHAAISHSEYVKAVYKNDIALIRIPVVAFSRSTRRIHLPTNYNHLESYANEWTYLAGWGRYSDSPATSTQLRYSRFQVITNRHCADIYGTHRIDNSKLCTNTSLGTSSCDGDSGSALSILHDNDKFTQIGISIFISADGCRSHKPNGFSRVDYYLDWILPRTGNLP